MYSPVVPKTDAADEPNPAAKDSAALRTASPMSYRKRNFEKLIIQIPCYNEAENLGSVLAELPREVEGFTTVEWLVIDDGSTDGTVEVAEGGGGVDWIVRQPRNMGLARAFSAGVEAALEVGADVIVNTDGDNQYCSRDIPTLVAPILAGKADLVIGTRPISEIEHFSRLKKLLQKLGSWVVRQVSQTDVPDSPSGFRAFSRGAAIRLNVFSEYTYTLETIIQAGLDGLVVSSVPIRTNRPLRESRLVKNVPSYLWQSAVTIVRIFLTYRPLRFFWLLGSLPLGLGALLGIRWMILSLGAPGLPTSPASSPPPFLSMWVFSCFWWDFSPIFWRPTESWSRRLDHASTGWSSRRLQLRLRKLP